MFMKYTQLKTQWPWFEFWMSYKVKCHKANWKVAHDSHVIYVFHANFDHMIHRIWETTTSSIFICTDHRTTWYDKPYNNDM